MKILRCHIENFGKLSELTIDFTQDLQVIYEQNGWGKSTLAAFVRVMFYGFVNERARNELDNERKKYKPWQGGIYGGQIIFEVNGKTYEAARLFGEKEKDDSFILYSADTNLECNDYSSALGEEIFKIDRESFSRTVFIAQNDIATNSTDSINARIGNLAENTDDINNYETVQKKLNDMLNALSPNRKTGAIKKRSEEIARLEVSTKTGNSIDAAIKQLNEKIIKLEEVRDLRKQEQVQVRNKMKEISEYKDLQNEKESYDRICMAVQTAKETLEEEKKYFPGRIPAEEEVQAILSEADKLSGYWGEMQSLKLDVEESANLERYVHLFHGGIPDVSELEDLKETIDKHARMQIEIVKGRLTKEEKDRLTILEKKFSQHLPADSDLDKQLTLWEQRNARKSVLLTNKATLNTLQNVAVYSENKIRTGDNRVPVILLIIGMILAVSGAGICFLQKTLGITGICIGILFLFLSLIFKMKGRITAPESQSVKDSAGRGLQALQDEINADETFITETELAMMTLCGEYNMPYSELDVVRSLYELKRQIQDYQYLQNRNENFLEQNLEQLGMKMEHEIADFLQRYLPDKACRADQFADDLHRLESRLLDYKRLRAQEQKYQKVKHQYDISYEMIVGFIGQLRMEVRDGLVVQVREILSRTQRITQAEKQAEQTYKEKAAFENEHETGKYKVLQAFAGEKTLEELNRNLEEITAERESIESHVSAYRKQLDDKLEEREKVSEDEEMLTVLRQEQESQQHHYRILAKTKELLETAKENFTARYMEPLMTGFEKYYGILTGQGVENYKMNASINITAKELGKQRDTNMLSTGSQDLIGICMRMALVDAMFQDEKPFIVIDDSLVNLDNEKVEGGMRLLKEIAKEYQVIYFTCHKSRKL